MRTMAIVMGMALCAAGCGGKDNGGQSTGPSPTVAAVTVGPEVNLLRIGLEQAYTATVRWSNGSTTTEAATWRSDAPAIATVDNAGRARGIDTGEATLVAAFQGAEDTLRIRVLPNYEGQWSGAAVVRTCRESGDWVGSDICRDLRTMAQLSSTFSLTQDRDRLSGTMTLDDIDAAIADGAIRNDGSASWKAGLVDTDQGMTLTIAFEPVEVRARADTITGAFTMKVTASGLKGDFTADFEVPQQLRSVAGVLGQPGTPFGGLRARLARKPTAR